MLDPRGNYTLLMPSNSSSENTRFDSPYSKSTHKYAVNHFWQQLNFGIFHFSGILPSNLKNFCSTIFNKFSRISVPPFLLLIGLFFLSLILIFYLFFSPLNDLDKNCFQLKSSEEIGIDQMEITNFGPQFFKKRIVHLDLKGAAPRPEYLAELFPLFARLNFNAILMEYEDMFPYSGELAKFARKTAYKVSTIEWINQMAESNGLELIPLVQTFGHMEFALKHAESASLREVPIYTDTICPSSDQSISLIRKMISQIRSLHPNAKSIHIGCDEAWHVGQDERCQHRLNTTLGGSLERLKMEHISKIARIAREEFNFSQVYAWNDMFDKTKVELLKEYNLGKLLIPVIWGYNRDVTQPGYFPGGLLERYSKVFDDLQFASAFKGANGVTQQFIDIQRYMDNLISYRQFYHQNKTLLDGRLSGIVLTGWQRFNHNRPLCELLPLGIPVMVKQAFYIADWDKQDPEDNSKLKAFLICSKKDSIVGENEFEEYKGKKFPIILETEMRNCQFPGVDLYREIENVHYLLWKYWSAKEPQSNQSPNVDEEELNKIEIEYQKLRKNKIAPTLAKYFFEDTVTEWMKQHKKLDDFQSDSVDMPRFDPI